MTDSIKTEDDHKVEDWSDKICFDISKEDNFPSNVHDIRIQKGIINRFLNFYLSGKIQKGLTARDIIFAMIAIMPFSLNTEEYVWEEDNYSDNGNLFFLTPEDRLKREIRDVLKKHDFNTFENQSDHQDQSKNQNSITESKLIASDIREATNQPTETLLKDATEVIMPFDDTLVWFRRKPIKRQLVQIEERQYGPVENSAFCTSCNKLLDHWDKDINARINLKYFFGTVALSLMRLTVKSFQHVVTMFTTTFPRNIACIPNYIHYSPPSEKCVKTSFKMLRRKDHKIQVMFAKLVINSFYLKKRYMRVSDRLSITPCYITNIFNMIVLAHTANYGMEIISMLQELAAITCFNDIFPLLLTNETKTSWIKIHNFLQKFMYVYSPSYSPTVYWARIIDREKFKYLSAENCYELAVVIGVIIEKLSNNNEIWNSRWAKTGSNIDSYKKLGLEVYEKFRKV